MPRYRNQDPPSTQELHDSLVVRKYPYCHFIETLDISFKRAQLGACKVNKKGSVEPRAVPNHHPEKVNAQWIKFKRTGRWVQSDYRDVTAKELETAAEELRVRGLITADASGDDWQPTTFFAPLAKKANKAMNLMAAAREKSHKEERQRRNSMAKQTHEPEESGNPQQPQGHQMEVNKPLTFQNFHPLEDGGAEILFSFDNDSSASWKVSKSELGTLQKALRCNDQSDSELVTTYTTLGPQSPDIDFLGVNDKENTSATPADSTTTQSTEKTMEDAVTAGKELLSRISDVVHPVEPQSKRGKPCSVQGRSKKKKSDSQRTTRTKSVDTRSTRKRQPPGVAIRKTKNQGPKGNHQKRRKESHNTHKSKESDSGSSGSGIE
ncbi:hypothetical protein Pelo_6902 [Pelomyxa schiedti]|nr:hypothetical protein Pelo_6902 [Pelomyxa schiedti]